MNRTEKTVCAAVVVGWLFAGVGSTADVFNMPPGLTSLEFVTVGNPGNGGELSGAGAGGYGPNRICGAVSYTYRIGKYEVTAGQYTEFLNAKASADDPYGLYDPGMWDSQYGCKILREGSPGDYRYSVAPDRANRPVDFVKFWNACRFANWLQNPARGLSRRLPVFCGAGQGQPPSGLREVRNMLKR